MSFSILLSLTPLLMPVSTECAATVLLSFRYPSIHIYFRIGFEGGVSFRSAKTERSLCFRN